MDIKTSITQDQWRELRSSQGKAIKDLSGRVWPVLGEGRDDYRKDVIRLQEGDAECDASWKDGEIWVNFHDGEHWCISADLNGPEVQIVDLNG